MAQGHEGPEYVPTPEERQRNREQARGGSPEGGAPARGNWWSRRSTKAKIAIIVGAVFLVAVIASAISGGGKNGSEISANSAQPTGIASTATPAVKSPAQIKVEARAQARAQTIARAKARVAARTKAKAAAAARVRAREAAAAHAAYVAAANRWHRGYYRQDANVYWQWRNGLSCQEFAQSGCWHVAVVTRDGCSSYVAVNANEYQGGAIVGQLLDNQGYGIPPQTVRIFELDADAGNVQANDVSIDCT
jgi:hypothetical protein